MVFWYTLGMLLKRVLHKKTALDAWLHTVWLYSGMITCLCLKMCVSFFVLFFYHYNLVCVCVCLSSLRRTFECCNISKQWRTENKLLESVRWWGRDISTGSLLRHLDYRMNQCTKTTDTSRLSAWVSVGMWTWLAHQRVLQVRGPLDIRLWSDQWFMSFSTQVSSRVKLTERIMGRAIEIWSVSSWRCIEKALGKTRWHVTHVPLVYNWKYLADCVLNRWGK